jgi:hypothetical protein
MTIALPNPNRNISENIVITTTASQEEAQNITIQIWETGSSAEVMFQMLWESARFSPGNICNSGPHLRLFAAWCARRTSHLLTDNKSYYAIQIAERFATATASCSVMHDARLAAEAVVIQIAAASERLAAKASTQPTTRPTNQTTNKIDTTATRTASILNAATAAATCCLTYQPFAALKAAHLCAKYARQSLYWEALTNGSDVVLITELLEEEDLRQSHTLRVLLGNPFDPDKSPPMFLPEPLPETL